MSLSKRSIQRPGPSEKHRNRKATSWSLDINDSLFDRGGDCRELGIEQDRGVYSAVEANGDVRRGSIGGGVMAPDQSMIGWMRRLHNEAGGEMGVLTVDVGGDCIRGGSASSSGV